MVIVLSGMALTGCHDDVKKNGELSTDSETSTSTATGELRETDSTPSIIAETDSSVLPVVAGETGYVCTQEQDCVSPLLCIDGKCQPLGCQSGERGCACGDGGACSVSSSGLTLQCVTGTCVYPDCGGSGQTGCPCLHNEICVNATDVCEGGICFAGNCTAGEEGCACNGGVCADGLMCKDGVVCANASGFPGGDCLANGACYIGARCDVTSNSCVACEPGSEGCQCGVNNTCDSEMSCLAGLCISPDMMPPENPKCYTPCLSNLVSETENRQCSDDGLLDGCISDFQCTDGSCLKEGEQKPVCSNDLDCPFFQTCLTGHCYSNCETNANCATGMACSKRVCRLPCQTTVGAAPCPNGMSCDTQDGETGFCMYVAPPSTEAPVLPTGGFALGRAMLSFTNISVSDVFQILSDSEFKQQFTIRKLRHKLTMKDGTVDEVVAPKDPETGEYTECDAAAGECPLFWLDMITGDNTTREATLNVTALPNCTEDDCPTIQIDNAGGSPGIRWEGELEVTSPNGRATIMLTYVERPEGQWVGTMYYFGNFADDGFDKWRARADLSDVSDVNNGLIQRWGALRAGSMTDGWEEFKAVLTATRTGSWKFGEVIKKCEAVNGAGTSAACYPFSNTAGVRTYVNDINTLSIPTGLSEFEIGMNLRLPSTEGNLLEGRIESSIAMHYAGNPAITLSFEKDPSAADACDPRVVTDCMVYLNSMDAEINVGGRYLSDVGAECGPGYTKVKVPWLVPEFNAYTALDPETNQLYRYECMDNELPFDVAKDAALLSTNISLAQANPVPDGLPRPRSLQLIDGALINQTDLFILFKEHFDSFVGGTSEATEDKGISAYGYMILKKQPVDLSTKDENGDGISDAFQGNAPPAETAKTLDSKLGVTCDAALLQAMVGVDAVDMDNVNEVVTALLDGSAPAAGDYTLDADGENAEVHYLCEATQLIDGGKEDFGGETDVRKPCPSWSNATFFVVNKDASDNLKLTREQISKHPCQQNYECTTIVDTDYDDADSEYTNTQIDTGIPNYMCEGATCAETLADWKVAGLVEEKAPYWQCEDTDEANCDRNRLNLREGKIFYATPEGQKTILSLKDEIQNAFRYKILFQNRAGAQIGFAPERCISGSNQIPYCYDPASIEHIRNRVDCLVHIYSDKGLYDQLGTEEGGTRNRLNSFLRRNFGEQRATGSLSDSSGSTSSDSDGNDGFERLYAELLVMLGDESLTSAFASRFDLAGAAGEPFQGDLFEEGGIRLTGVAGYEMFRLHQAIQYYQMALDRLYFAGPNFTYALLNNPSTETVTNFVSPDTVMLYLERLIGASTQKARAIGEVAKRYRHFNRPDLARRVIERAYTATYLESVILSRLMTDIAAISELSDKPQIRKTIENGQNRYRNALLDMIDVYSSITDDINFFGFSPDYIPFPALNASSALDINAFESLMEIANTRAAVARQREDQALASNRDYNTNTSSFQSELVRIRMNYENQLGEICGTFEGSDGQIYPAIQKYADKLPQMTVLDDPCGMMSNGSIYTKLSELENTQIELDKLNTRYNNIFEQIKIQLDQVNEQCGLTLTVAQYQFDHDGEVKDLQTELSEAQFTLQNVNGMVSSSGSLLGGIAATFVKGGGLAMGVGGIVSGGLSLAGAAYSQIFDKEQGDPQDVIIAKQEEIADINMEAARWNTEKKCQAADIDNDASTAILLLGVKEIELEAIQVAHNAEVILSEANRLRNEGKRLQAEQDEAEQLFINVETAKNDPNVRIYKNDAIINADIAFEDAMRSAYRATRVFEYYTSQTYAYKKDLFVIRTVGVGTENLENYLMQLENEYYSFQETYGNPDVRVAVLSLRDDIMNIPLTNSSGHPLSQSERIDMMRERLSRVELLDSRGYLSIPFSTYLEALSPLTRNHKIVYVEADVIGSDVGDTLGRLYLRQSGTGVVQNVADDKDFFVFPEYTAVIDPFFNGARLLSPEVYRSFRFMDRPLVNTSWELLINQRDEQVNKDINLQSLTDIRLYVYYTDFTIF